MNMIDYNLPDGKKLIKTRTKDECLDLIINEIMLLISNSDSYVCDNPWYYCIIEFLEELDLIVDSSNAPV